MKWNKFLFAAGFMAATLTVARAQINPTVHYFEPLHFDLTFTQQGLNNVETSSNNFNSTLDSYRITDKELLKLLASFLGTNWPAGARLAEDRSSYGLYIVDATGTNPVFNLTSGINNGFTNETFFRFVPGSSLTRDHAVIAPDQGGVPVRHIGGTYYSLGSFQLINIQNGTNQTELIFNGIRKTDYSSSVLENQSPFDIFPFYKELNLDESESVTGEGLLDGVSTMVEGEVTGSLMLQNSSLLSLEPVIPPLPFPPLPPPIVFPPFPPIIIITTPPPIIIITNRPPPILLHPNL